MPLHKKILRLLLASLAIAAVTGAAAVLVGESDTIWRVLGTALTTAGATLLLYPLSRLVDKPKFRLAGAFGLGVVVVEYLLIVAMIWEIPRSIGIGGRGEELLLTFLAGLITGVPATILLLIDAAEHSRIAARTGLGICAAALPCALVGSWVDSDLQAKLWLMAVFLVSFGCPIVLAMLELQHKRHWRWVGVAAGIIAAFMTIYAVWAELEPDRPTMIVILSSIAVAVAYANVMLLIPLKPKQQRFTYACIVMAVLTCLFIDLAMLVEGAEETFGRLAAAAGVMAACGTLAILILARLMRGVLSDARTASGQFTINLTCPRCRTRQDLPPGDGKCAKCDLRINIEIEEPTCPECGYLLLHLTGDNCPECGKPIASP